MDPSSSTAGPSLDGNGDDMMAIKFTTVEKFWDQIKRTTNKDILIFQDVSCQDFADLEKSRELRRRRIRFRRYYARSRILIVVIPLSPHEILHTQIYDECRHEIDQMGLRYHWLNQGAATHRPQGRPNRGDGGEGDSSGGPKQRRAGGGWPTLVVEAGNTQTMEQLRRDMRWWFAASTNHQVKIVLLAKLDRTRRRIILEKWVVETRGQGRPGATTTRAAAVLQPPFCSQTITITWAPGMDNTPTSHTVTRGALRLEFELMFLRPPSNPGEHDIIISIPKLQIYAVDVWNEVV
ncbi:hypothetical protein QBC46DRAFT_419815 [Diplogelasinospora grovesii]|uniref:Uncharacterized protein n=1 Tax=Diplogelasinospora grovesii TaxID=303347 RepID=A0AAN6S7M9_9PEZI|nr:hypothetical protein QBC46DRAFT_419815 [Diplogelasinospora grovesii]